LETYTLESTSKSQTILANIQRYESSEKIISDHFKYDGWTSNYNLHHDCRWDLEVGKDGVTITLEVKDESKYSNSGNLCIEGWQGLDKHPSGIETTRADVMIHIFDMVSAVYYTPEMKKWIRLHNPKILERFNGADNYNGGWLVKKKDISEEKWFGIFPTMFISGCRIIQAIFNYRRNR
jgi:hypothetical protein